MADPSYTIRARLELDPASLARIEARLRKLENDAAAFKGQLRQVREVEVPGMKRQFDELAAKSRLAAQSVGATRDAWGTMVGSLGSNLVMSAIGGLKDFAANTLQLHVSAETAQAGIMSLFMTMESMNAAAAGRASKTVIQQLSEDAAAGVGALEDYVDAYRVLYQPLRSRGASLEDIRGFVRQSLTAGFASGRGSEGLKMAPLDILQALQQGVNPKITPIAISALQAAGIGEKQFNAADGAKQLDFLRQGFGKFNDAAVELGKTVDAQQATLSDSMNRFLREITGPAFESYQRSLIELNSTIAASNGQVSAFSEALKIPAQVAGGAIEQTASSGTAFVQGLNYNRLNPLWTQATLAVERLSGRFDGLGKRVDEVIGGMGVMVSGMTAWAINTGARLVETMMIHVQYPDERQAELVDEIWSKITPDVPTEDMAARLGFGSAMNADPVTLGEVIGTKTGEKVGKAIAKKPKLDVTVRLEYGNDRQTAANLTRVIERVAERASMFATSSSAAIPYPR